MKKTIPALIAFAMLLLSACEPQIEDFLSVSGASDQITVKASGDTFTLDVSASQEPSVSAQVMWVGKKLRNRNNTYYSYDVTVSPNNDTIPRQTQLRIASGVLVEEITIRQEAKEVEQKEDSTQVPPAKAYTLRRAGEASATAVSGQDTLVLPFITDVPPDSLQLDVEAEWIAAQLQDSLIRLTLQDFHLLEVRKTDITLSSLVGDLEPLTWEVTQEPTVVTPEGMVEFEDFRFKKAVVDLHDTDGDNEISVPEAEAIMELDVSGMGIRSVKGVEPMRNLRKIDMRDNDMFALLSDISQFDDKSTRVFDEEKITMVDFSDPHPYLTEIAMDGGVDLDITGCPPIIWMPRNPEYAGKDGYLIIRHLIRYQNQLDGSIPKASFVRYDKLTETTDTCRSKDFSRHFEKIEMQKHTRGEGIQIGFTIIDLIDTDVESDMDDRIAEIVLENLFKYEPMKSFRDCFDVNYYVTVLSTRRTNPDRDMDEVFDRFVFPFADLGRLIIDINMSISSSNYQNAYCNQADAETLAHEYFGHTWRGLVDEYGSYQTEVSQDWLDSHGYRPNISLTPDPELVRWNRFFKEPEYHDHVGIFDGAAGGYGVYRSSRANIMGNENPEYGFAPWHRYLLMSKILHDSRLVRELFPEFTEIIKENPNDPDFVEAKFQYFIEHDKEELKRQNEMILNHMWAPGWEDEDLSWEYKQQFKE